MIQTTTLSNGLVVLSDRMESVETVSVGIWAGVGSRHETDAQAGLCHLLEHMAFKGTRRRSAYAIAEAIEAVGGQLNAYTGREATAYFAKVLAEDLPLAVDLLSDIVAAPALDADDLARERQVILQEIGQAVDQPDDIIFDHFQQTAFRGQALGRSVLGERDALRALDRDGLAATRAAYYGAERLVLAAAGRVDHDRLVALAEAGLGHLPRHSEALAAPARYTGGDYREARETEETHLLIGLPGAAQADGQYYTEQVLSMLLGGGMSSRLFQTVRETHGLAYHVGSLSLTYADAGVLGVYTATAPEDTGAAAELILTEIMRLAETLDEDEVARAKTQLRAQILMSLESTSARCEALALHQLAYGRPVGLDEVAQSVAAVTPADVAALARRLPQAAPTVAAMGPLAHVPSYERVAERLG